MGAFCLNVGTHQVFSIDNDTFLTVLGVLIVLFPFIPTIWWDVIVVTGTLFLFMITFKKRKPPQLAGNALDETKEILIAETRPSREMLLRANELARKVFGNDTLSFAEAERWYIKNPLIICILRNKENRVLGYFDILPLNKKGVELIESGRYHEREITGEHILPPQDMKKATKLYFSGIVASGYETGMHEEITANLFWSFSDYILNYYGERKRRILALAATKVGERLLKNWKAKLLQSKESRSDGFDLYEFMITRKFLEKIKQRAERKATPPMCKWK